MAKEIMIGGQAVLEGVMMRTGDHYAVAVRKPNGKIVVKKELFKTITKKHKILSLPFIRGMILLYETLVLGIKAMNFSAAQVTGEEQDDGWFSAIMVLLSILIAILVFKFVPLLIATVSQNLIRGDNLTFNLIEGGAKLTILIVYLLLIGQLKDIKRVFQYHGAEHKAVACHEKGLLLTVKNVKKENKEHPRCGTGFILLVVIISMVFYITIPLQMSLGLKLLFRLLLLPIIAGVSFEVIRLSGKYPNNTLVKAITMPSLTLQRLTTKEPDNKQIEVAIRSLNSVLR